MAIDYNKDSFYLNNNFEDVLDVKIMEFQLADNKASLYFLDGFVDKLVFEDHIFNKLLKIDSIKNGIKETITQYVCPTSPIIETNKIEECVDYIMHGDIVLLVDTAEKFYVFSEKIVPSRTISEPPVNSVIRGPREGFTEEIKTNMTLIRKRLYTKYLKFKLLTVGRLTKTHVVIAYISNIADKTIVDKIEERINNIDIDGIIESSYIARFIEDNGKSLFNQIGKSEKPDIVVGKLLEGRVAVIVDGSPSVLTLPFIYIENFQTSEDYYSKSYRATLVRFIRLTALVLAVFLPGYYVAFQEFHYHLLPFNFLIAIIEASNKIPLTPTLEMLVVIVLFEVLSEASIRMPRYISMALSVVGAIVLGETAVSAGLLSTPTILVIAISTLGIYCVPDEVSSSTVLRLISVLLGGLLGILGLALMSVVIIAYLASLESYNCSYLTPFAPMKSHDWQDSIYKDELKMLKERPYSIPTNNRVRQK